jgi:hypothetical protein
MGRLSGEAVLTESRYLADRQRHMAHALGAEGQRNIKNLSGGTKIGCQRGSL